MSANDKLVLTKWPDRKGIAICCNFTRHGVGAALAPVAYIQRAKHVSPEAFKRLCDGLSIMVREADAEFILDEVFPDWEMGQ